MKKKYTLFLCVVLCIVTSCEELEYDHVLIVVTDETVDRPQYSNAATLKGTILDIGDSPVTDHGFCYDISADNLNLTLENAGNAPAKKNPDTPVKIGEFESRIFGLGKTETYAYRAYAKTAGGVKYGKQYTFFVDQVNQPVFSAQVNNISKTVATAVGKITADQLGAIDGAIQEYGHCWSTETLPEITDSKLPKFTDIEPFPATMEFTSNITGLAAGTTYSIRAYIIPTGSTTPIYSENEVTITTVQ